MRFELNKNPAALRPVLLALALCSAALSGCAPQNAVVKAEAPAPTPSSAAAPAPATASAPAAPANAVQPPASPREFRAVWVSTVANIDWPSRRDLTVAQQKAEIEATLDKARAMNLNAIVLQVRPSADAIYPSKIEPWTEYLTGTQGKAPDPFYDPLQLWIDGAHARGMELHAWFNPYRARQAGAKSAQAPNHITVKNPAVVKAYGQVLWMDPNEPSAQQQTLDVMLDVVKRYDVDGVHIDDYFYPYPIPVASPAGANDNGLSNTGPRPEVEFPDEASWNRYLAGGGKLSRADWRRDGVNQLMERIYNAVKKEKSWVKVGISPFGLPRPDRRPASIEGFSQYDKLYADAELWFNKGWLDYFVPQLYWATAQKPQSFPVLMDYWITQNTMGRALWPGLFTSRVGDRTARGYPVKEITDQIEFMRARPNNIGGHIHFSMVALTQDRDGLATTLAKGLYAVPALTPAMPWLDKTLPAVPSFTARPAGADLSISFKPGAGKAAFNYGVWAQCSSGWRFYVQPVAAGELKLPAAECSAPARLVVTAVDRLGMESKPTSVNIP